MRTTYLYWHLSGCFHSAKLCHSHLFHGVKSQHHPIESMVLLYMEKQSPINIPPLLVSINIPAPAGSVMGMSPGLGATFRRPAAFVALHAAGFLGATAAEAPGGDAAGLGDDAPGRTWGSSKKPGEHGGWTRANSGFIWGKWWNYQGFRVKWVFRGSKPMTCGDLIMTHENFTIKKCGLIYQELRFYQQTWETHQLKLWKMVV